jgi:excisionase family DNA binding protein
VSAARTLTDADLAALRELVREEIARNGPVAPEPSPWLTSEDVAAHLACSSRSVQNYARRGVLRCSRVGGLLRFRREDVEAFARGRRLEVVR